VEDINKKFLKESFNIDVDSYSPEELDKVLEIINKNILIRSQVLIDKCRSMEEQIDYYRSLLDNK
jgi:hypothetical protein